MYLNCWHSEWKTNPWQCCTLRYCLEVSEIPNDVLNISSLCADTLIWKALTWDLPSEEADVDKKEDDLAPNFRDASTKADNAGRDEEKKRPSDPLFSFSMKTPAGRGHGEATGLLRGIWVTHKDHR